MTTPTEGDPRSAEPAPTAPYEEAPSATGVVADDAPDDGDGRTTSDQQAALEDAVERGDPDGSAAAGA